SSNYAILTKSCADTKDTIKWEDGNEYPLFKMEISSDTHPFFTGKAKVMDTGGRIDKFQNRYKKFQK
ncbi:MAG: type B 50S ribosomal protein L31, partial [Bacteroidetes bacterium]|nr:type B 50S ribosomal protein L31 [Bacteroidota bacterium]